MDCKIIKDNISLFVDGKLSGKELDTFMEHISKCPDCSKILKQTQGAIKFVSGFEEQPLPTGFYERLNRKLNIETAKSVKQPPFQWIYVMRSAATVAALVFVVFMVQEFKKKEGNFGTGIIMQRKNVAVKEQQVKPYKEKAKLPEESNLKDEEASVLGKKLDVADERLEVKYKSVPTSVESTPSVPQSDSLELKEEESKLQQNKVMAGAYEAEKKSEKPAWGMKKRSFAKTAPAAMPQQAPAEITEFLGYYSGITAKETRVIKDNNSWENFWKEHSKNQLPVPEAPQIDFNKKMVLVLFMGQQNSGGYSIRIENIQKFKDELIVEYRLMTPKPNEGTTAALTQPYHIKIIEKSGLPVTFKEFR